MKNLTHADEISSALNTPKDVKIQRGKKPSGSAERRPTKRNSWSRALAKIAGRSF
jgi:lipoate-protein ligase A